MYCKVCWPKHNQEHHRLAVAASAAAIADPAKRAERNRNISAAKLEAIDQEMKALGYEATDWEEIAPGVATLSLKQIMAATGHAVSFSSQIKRGNFRPHPRHWKALREVVESVGR
jgi:hypothetical protein